MSRFNQFTDGIEPLNDREQALVRGLCDRINAFPLGNRIPDTLDVTSEEYDAAQHAICRWLHERGLEPIPACDKEMRLLFKGFGLVETAHV